MNDTDSRRIIRAGTALADILGIAVAAMDDRKPFNPIEADLARSAVLLWHLALAEAETV